MAKDFNVYKWRREHLTENVTPIKDYSDARDFLYNDENREKILKIADEHKGDIIAMQAALNDFLAQYIIGTPEEIVTLLKANIGRGILRRNVASNPKSTAILNKLKK